jgi:PAS domain S-box-containing protein
MTDSCGTNNRDIVRKSEEKFSKVFHSSPTLMAISTIEDGRFLDVNETLLRTLLFSREEVVGKTSLELGILADPAQRQAIRKMTEEKGYAKNIETQMVTKNGQIIDGLFSAEPITINNEKCWLTVMVDVTEQKRVEKSLQASNELFSSFMLHSPIYTYIKEVTPTQSVVLQASDNYRQMIGISGSEMVGKTMTELFPPEFAAKIIADDWAVVARGDVLRLEEELNGHSYTTIKFPITRGDKTLLGGYTIDITDHKRAEEKIRESEDRFRVIFERSTVGMSLTAADGELLRINKEFANMLGYTMEEIQQLNFAQLTHPDDIAKSRESIRVLLADEQNVYRMEKRYLHKSGDIVWVDLSTTLLRDEQGMPLYFITTIVNITERKREEEEKQRLVERLQRAEKMEALGTLAGGVAHDLNNVLGILTGYSELLLMEIPEESRSRGHVDKILQSAEKGAAIIQDLLTLARRGVTATDVINFNYVVADFTQSPVFEKLKEYHPQITFRVECEKNLLNIKGSPVHLEKTLMNLVSNAAEAVAGAGNVTIRTESRHLDKPLRGYDEVKEGDYVVLTVSDTGKGIPPEDREKIFEPFYTKKKMGRSGTGLGLAIVWGTVKDHDGYIDLQTGVGQGTTFTLYFPMTREELGVPRQKEPMEQFMGQGELVLVVDDNADQREIASRLLTQLNYLVHSVPSGEEAVEYLKRNRADILVLDMIMKPGIDGLETYQRVIAANPHQKAIIVSGFAETDRVKEARRLGAGIYVKKPYVLEKIGVAIRDELAGNR